MPAPAARSRSASVPCGAISRSSRPAANRRPAVLSGRTKEQISFDTWPDASRAAVAPVSRPPEFTTRVRSRAPCAIRPCARAFGMPLPKPASRITAPSAMPATAADTSGTNLSIIETILSWTSQASIGLSERGTRGMANPGPAAPLPCSGSEQVISNETIRIGGRFRPEGNDMKPRRLALEAGQWYGWQEVPVPHPGWGASPVYLIDAEPLKTGKGILRLSFIQALHPVCATKRSIDLRVGVHTPGAIAGSFAATDGTAGTATISAADIGWLKGYCP